jgi:hypothetical protein
MQLSQNMDCVIEEEKNESSKKNTNSSAKQSDKIGNVTIKSIKNSSKSNDSKKVPNS